MKLQNIKKIVIACLEGEPATRNSDRILYDLVCRKLGFDTLGMSAYEMLHRKDMPSTESVRRARQKAQAENEELRPCAAVEAMRMQMESEYRSFAREGA